MRSPRSPRATSTKSPYVSRVLTGLGVSPGVALGSAIRISVRQPLPTDSMMVDAETAHQQVSAALATVASDLEQRAASTDESIAGILAAHVMILGDPVLSDRIRAYLDEGFVRLAAVEAAFGEFKAALAGGDAFFAERIGDLDDLQYRVSCALLGLSVPNAAIPDHGCVVVADDLGPADLVGLDLGRILAIVTKEGSMTTHTAIVARSLGMPAVVACADALSIEDNMTVLVDGRAGSVTVGPDAAETEIALAHDRERRSRLAQSRGAGRTKDGTGVQLLVNIDVSYEAAAQIDSEGVGLFRTEFLYLDRSSAPTFDEQVETYLDVFAAFAKRKVVVRTLDAGADKSLGFADVGAEPNPALGVRGLRVARQFPELLDVQLRAIAAAASTADADVWVMAPMVSTVAEARHFAATARAVGLTNVGVMVEVPALALRASQVLEVCDFVSLGTNDLSQYAFAADRMLTSLSDLVDPWQPALLELVRLTAEAGLRSDRPVGVCGEAASDPLLALVLVGLGVSSLSMSPVSLADVRATLAAHDIEECRTFAEVALAAENGAEARAVIRHQIGLG